MHLKSPLAEELENVPRGHGSSATTPPEDWLGIPLYPEANRAYIRSNLKDRNPLPRRIASVEESIGFLGNSKSHFYKNYNFNCKSLSLCFTRDTETFRGGE